MPKSELWIFVLRSARSISARFTLFSRAISARRACSAAGVRSGGTSGTVNLSPPRAKGDAAQRLIDVHPMKLFSVGIKPHGIVAFQNFANAITEPILHNFEPA